MSRCSNYSFGIGMLICTVGAFLPYHTYPQLPAEAYFAVLIFLTALIIVLYAFGMYGERPCCLMTLFVVTSDAIVVFILKNNYNVFVSRYIIILGVAFSLLICSFMIVKTNRTIIILSNTLYILFHVTINELLTVSPFSSYLPTTLLAFINYSILHKQNIGYGFWITIFGIFISLFGIAMMRKKKSQEWRGM